MMSSLLSVMVVLATLLLGVVLPEQRATVAGFALAPSRHFHSSKIWNSQRRRRGGREASIGSYDMSWSRRSSTRSCGRSARTVMDLGGAGGLWDSYLSLLDTAPLLTKAITAGLIFPAADVAAQKWDTKENEDGGSVDLARAFRWCIFGFAVQAPWNHYFFGALDQVIPPAEEAFSATTALKVFIDQGLQAPVFTVIIFAVLGFLEGKDTEKIKSQLDEDYKPTMIANWKLWLPASFINLAFCPPPLRVLFTNVVFFCWTVFLSLVVNKASEEGEA